MNDAIQIVDGNNGHSLCSRAVVAATFFDRLKGLLGRQTLASGEGLLIRHTSSIHTVGMNFPIDVIALDREMRVVGLRPRMQPSRVAIFPRRTASVLELPADVIERMAVRPGHQLMLSSAAAASDFEKDLLPV